MTDAELASNANVKAFIGKLAQICWDCGSLDAWDLQEMLVEAGYLVEIEVSEQCGEECRCVEYDPDPPWKCYRLSEAFK